MDTNNQKLIDRFLLGELTAHEEATFLEKLEKDQEFKALYESSKQEFEHMQLFAEGNLRSQMTSWEKENAVAPVDIPAKKFQLGTLLIALTALILILLISFYVIKPKADPVMLAAKYYQPDFSGVRASEDDPFENVKYILEGRKQSSYAGIQEALSQIPNTNERYDEAQYYLAHLSYFGNDFESSKKYFQSVSINSKLKEKAEWYTILCEIQLENESNFENSLKKISNTEGHSYQKKAIKLLEDLDQL